MLIYEGEMFMDKNWMIKKNQYEDIILKKTKDGSEYSYCELLIIVSSQVHDDIDIRLLDGVLDRLVRNDKLSKKNIEEVSCYQNTDKLREKINSIELQKSELQNNYASRKLKRKKYIVVVICVMAVITLIGAVVFWLVMPIISYNKAGELFASGDYINANARYESARGYKNAENMKELTDYLKNDDYTDAIDFAGTSNDLSEYIPMLTDQREVVYIQKAQQYMEDAKYEEAVSMLEDILGYENSEELLKESKIGVQYNEALKAASVSLEDSLPLLSKLPEDFRDVKELKKMFKVIIDTEGCYVYSEDDNYPLYFLNARYENGKYIGEDDNGTKAEIIETNDYGCQVKWVFDLEEYGLATFYVDGKRARGELWDAGKWDYKVSE